MPVVGNLFQIKAKLSSKWLILQGTWIGNSMWCLDSLSHLQPAHRHNSASWAFCPLLLFAWKSTTLAYCPCMSRVVLWHCYFVGCCRLSLTFQGEGLLILSNTRRQALKKSCWCSGIFLGTLNTLALRLQLLLVDSFSSQVLLKFCALHTTSNCNTELIHHLEGTNVKKIWSHLSLYKSQMC